MAAKMYGLFLKSLANKEIDLDTDTLKAMLCTSAYTPDQDTHQYKSSITNEVSTVATTLAASAASGATTVSLTASIPVGTRIAIDTGGTPEYRDITAISGAGPYSATVAALSAAHSSGATVQASPGYTAGGQALTGVTVTYTAGTNTLALDANDPAWAASAITARAIVFYDSSPATDATRPLIAYDDFGSDQISSNGTFTYQINAAGIATITAA